MPATITEFTSALPKWASSLSNTAATLSREVAARASSGGGTSAISSLVRDATTNIQ